MEPINKIWNGIETDLVSIADIGAGYNDWEPDLRVDPRLRERLLILSKLCRGRWGQDFMLPVSSCYRPFLWKEKGHWIGDATDPRGHWSGLAIDMGYRNVLKTYEDWKAFVKFSKKAGLKRIHLRKLGEWWHFSDYGIKYKKWRPVKWIAKLRFKICRKKGIL